MIITVKSCLYSAVAVLTLITSRMEAQSVLFFDNSQNDLRYRFNPGTFEVGDEIVLQSGGLLTSFAFEFYGTNSLSPANVSFAGTVEARVRFYHNDGALFNGYASPGTLLFDSNWVTLTNPTPRNTLVFESGEGLPPDGLFLDRVELTWSVQFRGMGASDEVGIDIYSPPTVGHSWPDYWILEPGRGWVLETNVVPMNFAARFMGTIPEPSPFAIALNGAVLLFLCRRMRGR